MPDTPDQQQHRESSPARLLAVTTVVVLLMGPQIATMMREEPVAALTAYKWQHGDSVVLALLIVSIALVGVGLGTVARRLGGKTAALICGHLFVVALGAGLITNFWFNLHREHGYHPAQHGMEVWTLWLLLVGGAGYSLGRRSTRLVNASHRLAMILSPVALILLWQVLTFPTYPSPCEPFPPARCQASALTGRPAPASTASTTPDIYLFIFDEWSYERSYSDGRLAPLFEHLADLQTRSLVFHDAHSCGTSTVISVPRLLFQTDLMPIHAKGEVGFLDGTELIPSDHFDSLFTLVNHEVYTTYVVASTLSYRSWLKNQVDVCRSHIWYTLPQRTTPFSIPAACVFRALKFQGDPWSTTAYQKIKQRLDRRAVGAMHNMVLDDCREIITREQRPAFLLCHYLLPHGPMAWDAEGNLRPHDRWYEATPDVYRLNLRVLDRHIGMLTDMMRQAQRYDDALIIMTSDHAWRADPGMATGEVSTDLTHVPLIVKLPDQASRFDVYGRFDHLSMRRLIQRVLEGQRDPGILLTQLDGSSETPATNNPERDSSLVRTDR